MWYLSHDASQYPTGIAAKTKESGKPKTGTVTQSADKSGIAGSETDTKGAAAGTKTPDAGSQTGVASTTQDHSLNPGAGIRHDVIRPDASPEDNYKQEMYYYAKLVEIKHKELTSIEKDEPLLYRQFSGDVNKLDSVYRTLKKQLPENPNKEQLLEAMLQNLQLQMGLLNHQLDIIKQINHSKKTAYEKAYKTA